MVTMDPQSIYQRLQAGENVQEIRHASEETWLQVGKSFPRHTSCIQADTPLTNLSDSQSRRIARRFCGPEVRRGKGYHDGGC
jgi:hypothetical protein